MQFESRQEESNISKDVSYIRTGDAVGLATIVHVALGKFYLSVFVGSQYCNLTMEPPDDQEPTLIWKHSIKIADAISVHAIPGWHEREKQGSRSVLLYGQAILLQLLNSKYLRCLPYHTCKIGRHQMKDNHAYYLIGLTQDGEQSSVDANCWFTIHPATKQRSDGEKVQAGDEIFLVNVGTKRYLSLSQPPSSSTSSTDFSWSVDFDEESFNEIPVATFTPLPWIMDIIQCTEKAETFTGYLNGGDPIQLKLPNRNEVTLTSSLPISDSSLLDDSQHIVYFEDKSSQLELRSVWNVMLSKVCYGRGFIEWGQAIRLINSTSGKYLGVEGNKIVLVDGKHADRKRTLFCFAKKPTVIPSIVTERQSMGAPTIKFGDSEVFLLHIDSRKWVGIEMMSLPLRKLRTGTAGPPTAVVFNQLPSNNEIVLNKSFHIALSATLCNQLETILKALATSMGYEGSLKPMKESTAEKALARLRDMIPFLQPPNKNKMDFHSYQDNIMRLKNRLIRFQNHGVIQMTFALLKHSVDHYESFPTKLGQEIQQTICEILVAMIQKNRPACQKFANEQSLDDLMELVNITYLSHSMLKMINCLLQESPEVLVSLNSKHLSCLFNLLYRNGRDSKIMSLLGTLCVCQGVAMREKQNQICHLLKNSSQLLLHTTYQPKLYSLFADVFLTTNSNCQQSKRWYYEFQWTPPKDSNDGSLTRVGFAIYSLFQTYPVSKNLKPTKGALGDDLFSVGFDGRHVWLNGVQHAPKQCANFNQDIGTQTVVYGCSIDLENFSICFTFNGRKIPLLTQFENNENYIIVPSVSIPGGTENAKFCFGNELGELIHKPPDDYMPLYYFKNDSKINLLPFLDVGNHKERILNGPKLMYNSVSFIPSVSDVTHISIPESLKDLHSKLAINFHNQWCVTRIDNGYRYGDTLDEDNNTDPRLCSFDDLPPTQEDYKYSQQIIATLLFVGCRIVSNIDNSYCSRNSNTLPDVPYLQSNGFKPHLISHLCNLPHDLVHLVNYLAERTHNMWVKEKLSNGWTYGLATRCDIKQDKLLVPYPCLPQATKDIYIKKEKDIVLTVISLGFKIYPPPIEQMKDDYALSQIPFTTYRGHYDKYCCGEGKWYFKVKLLKGKMVRVGWATPGLSPMSLLGSDSTSYAIDGYHACKWQDNVSEKFGQIWEEGDTITCFLDLDNQTMSFARDNKLLNNPSGNTVAFSGFPKDCIYVPAVSVFIGEQVQMLLKPEEVSPLKDITLGYEAIEERIKSPIPLWYSDHSNGFQIITSSHPYLSQVKAKESIMIHCKEMAKHVCLRLNMGVMIEEFNDSDMCLREDDSHMISYSVVVPVGQNPSLVYVGWVMPEFIYRQEHYIASSDDVMYKQYATIKDEYDNEMVNYQSSYLVKVSRLLDMDTVSLTQPTQIDCILNTETGHMTFKYSTPHDDYSSDITLQMAAPGKLFPAIISDPMQSEVCQFVFAPTDKCKSLASVLVYNEFVEETVNDHLPCLLPSMQIMSLAKSRWYQMEEFCTSYNSNAGSMDTPCLPCCDQFHMVLPQEESVIGFTEVVETPELYLYHVETLRTLQACCALDNMEAAKEIKEMINWNELISSVKESHWDYQLRYEYFNLLNALYLEHEVSTVLLTQEDSIIAINSKQTVEHRRKSFSLDGSISTQYSHHHYGSPQLYDKLNELKGVIFEMLDTRRANNVFMCRMLSDELKDFILLPLLTALDGLLVLSLLNTRTDRKKLLSLLHPSLAPPNFASSFYLLTMKADNKVKSMICRILEHLCDCQLYARINDVVQFSKSYVSDLQDDQKLRADKCKEQLFSQVIQEMNTPTEKQLQDMIMFDEQCLTSALLQENLEFFHTGLIAHCRASYITFPDSSRKNLSILKKLQKVIISITLKWAREGIDDVKLTEQVYGLLYRQFNETDKLIHALKHTYIIEYTSEFHTESILKFREALGQVRKMLKIGFGDKEEILLEKMLSKLRTSKLFTYHADLLRLVGLHTLVVDIMKSYSSFSSTLQQYSDVIKINQRLKISQLGFVGTIEECCKFLCAFAQTSRQNQSVLFEHIPYFIDLCIKDSDQLSSDTCNPLDVAIATINNNLDLALDLNEDHFNQLMVLMDNMTKYDTDESNDSINSSRISFMNTSYAKAWLPCGAEKCLKFLLSAVWVNGETVSQNAFVIIKLLIQHPECLGPGYSNQTLSLVDIFTSSISQLKDTRHSVVSGKRKTGSMYRQETMVKIEPSVPDTPPGYMKFSRHNSSTLNLSSLTAGYTISFYNTLLRLLSYCTTSSSATNDKYSSDHILPFLQSLVSLDTLKTLLSFPLHIKSGLSPLHKEALLVFLDRVYSINDHKELLELMNSIFLPDIEATLQMIQKAENRYEITNLFRYLCQYVLPFIESHSSLFSSCGFDLLTLKDLMYKCYLLTKCSYGNNFYGKKINDFMIMLTKILPPQAILHMLPHFLNDIKGHSPSFKTTVKVLTAHYSHYSQYYSSGILLKSCYKSFPPSKNEKAYISLLFSWLFEVSHNKAQGTQNLITECLKALASSILPETVVPSLQVLSVELSTGNHNSGSCIETLLNCNIPNEWTAYFEDFAKFVHENWVFERQQTDGWRFAPVFSGSSKNDNRLKPFECLNGKLRLAILEPAKQILQIMFFYGCNFVRNGSVIQVPHKTKSVCIQHYSVKKMFAVLADEPSSWYNYDPSVIDLSKVQLPFHYHSIIESTVSIFDIITRPSSPTKKGVKSNSVPALAFHKFETEYNPLKYLYAKHSNGMNYGFVSDFLKFLKVKGIICTGSFSALPISLQMTLNKIECKPFGGQLFEDFLSMLSSQCQCSTTVCRCKMHKHQLFSVICEYLNMYIGYFNQSFSDNESKLNVASLEEKIQIAQFLYQVHIFMNNHIDDIVEARFEGEAPPIDCGLACFLSLREKNPKTLQNILRILHSIVKAIDTSEKQVLKELDQYLNSVVETLNTIPESIAKLTNNTSGVQSNKLILYYLYCVIPTLTVLFQQFSEKRWSYLTDDNLYEQLPIIFNTLYSTVVSDINFFIKSGTISMIGQCLSGLCKVYYSNYKNAIIGNQIFCVKESSLESMLVLAAASTLNPQEMTLTAVVIVPVLISVLEFPTDENGNERRVDRLLKLILRVISQYQFRIDINWMTELCTVSCKLATCCSFSILKTHLIPILMSLSGRGEQLWQKEQLLLAGINVKDVDVMNKQKELNSCLKLFVNDLASYFMFLNSFCHHHGNHFSDISHPLIVSLYEHVGMLLNYFFSSQRFSVHLDSYLCPTSTCQTSADKYSWNPLLSCAVILVQNLPHSILKIFDHVQHIFNQSVKSLDQTVLNSIQNYITGNLNAKIGDYDDVDDCLSEEEYRKLQKEEEATKKKIKHNANVILNFARVRNLMLKTKQGTVCGRFAKGWKQLVSRQKREAIIRCLKAVPFYRLKKHRAMNLFIQGYCTQWLKNCEQLNMESLCEQLLDREDYEQAKAASSNQLIQQKSFKDPLKQLFALFEIQASTQQWDTVCGTLYYSYSNAIIKTLEWLLDSFQDSEENVAKAYEHFYGRLAQATLKQEQLIKRGVPHMILHVFAATNGHFNCPLLHITLKLAIVQLEGGNLLAQKTLLAEITKANDEELWLSISKLIMSCSVLNWNSYERSCNSGSNDIAEKVFPLAEHVIDLFRFLQLLCEGHNECFQNLLREQNQNSTSVNIVIATVDYLLKLQESIRDFYWHHAHQDALELPARESFLIAFKVARQMFRTLSEYIQGPCIGNQEVLSGSRLWDALSGFLHVFVALQHKLFKHTNHIELLREMLALQEEMFILLFSLLEGSTMSSSVGQHMLSMLEECHQLVNQLIVFYHIFIKLKDSITSDAFKDYDLNKDGLISYHEFTAAVNAQQHYTKQEIDYLIQLSDTNKDGLLDYQEFTERFHQPTHNLGFHICALLQQLSDVLPGDPRLKKFKEASAELFKHFESNMGCIEVMGKSGKIERVYFRIKSSHVQQWNEQPIKESRLQFLHGFDLSSQREKLTGFVNFCEDTIFQMNYNDQILGMDQEEKEIRAEKHRQQHFPVAGKTNTRSLFNRFHTKLTTMRARNSQHVIFKLQNVLSMIWFTLLIGVIIQPTLSKLKLIKTQCEFIWHKGEGSLRLPTYFIKTKQWPSLNHYIPHIKHSLSSFTALFATNYYNISWLLSVITLIINILILLTKKDSVEDESISYNEALYELILNLLVYLHFFLSVTSILSFCYLKVPLIVFKNEKGIVRRLENNTNNNLTMSFLDSLVIKSHSFPRLFWDKQVKERVLNRASTKWKDSVSKKLGIESICKFDTLSKRNEFCKSLTTAFDFRYLIWKCFVICNNFQFLYKVFYCFVSFIGLYVNVFFFSVLLLDLMLQSKILMTVLRVLSINYKQLIVTLALTAVIVYIYTVIAYNYFGKFYIREIESGQLKNDCNDMLTCFLFHLDKGIRSGGGIADAIISAFDDHQYYSLRLVFDLSFFLFVIVILIALFQGLIIDAFGELRKKDDTVVDELKNKCFICGIAKTDFDSPHEFDVHTHNHHSMRNYMFFLMHLIGKPETEFTGQESYVWKKYLKEQWDFFPAGTCFQIQEKARQQNETLISKRRQRFVPNFQPVSPPHILNRAHTIAKVNFTKGIV